jgi:DNA-binding NarL/FixJ family response regulator
LDTHLLEELKTASGLIEAPNLDNRPKEKDLVVIFKNIKEIKKRNSTIVKAYKEGYSQHMIAKVLGMAQSTINGIVKRCS